MNKYLKEIINKQIYEGRKEDVKRERSSKEGIKFLGI